MDFNLILFKSVLSYVVLSCSFAAVINNDVADATRLDDLKTSATSAKLLNLGSLLGCGNTGYYPNRPVYYPSNGYNTNGGYYPNVGKYPTTNVGSYYPNNNYYPTTGTNTHIGTNILGGDGGYVGNGGYGGYGGYGGNGGLRQYYGYRDPTYTGHRNLGYAYYTNTNSNGLPRATNDNYGSRERDHAPYTFRGYN